MRSIFPIVALAVAALVALFYVYNRTKSVVYTFPKPTGHYAVGTKRYHFVDESRCEPHVDDETCKRELMVQLWYPAELTGERKPCPYAPDVMPLWRRILVNMYEEHGLDLSKLEAFHELHSYACENFSLLQDNKPYPVILLSPGLNALRTGYSVYCEELASHGYIVVGISHPYASFAVVFPDEREVLGKELALDDPEASAQEQETWVRDARFVLDKLEEMNTSAEFAGALDLKKVGMFGHSFGGSTAVQMARNDDRVHSCVNLDGALWGNNVTKGFAKPCMFMLASEGMQDAPAETDGVQDIKIWRAIKERYTQSIEELSNAIKQTGGTAYTVVVGGSKHNSFSDWILLGRLRIYADYPEVFSLLKTIGSIDGDRMVEIVRAYLLDFFDMTLRGIPPRVLSRNVYSEVSVEKQG